MKKYINDLNERKKQIREEIKKLENKRSDLISKKHKLMRENSMIEFNNLYGQKGKDKDLNNYYNLLKGAIASGLICLSTAFLPNGLILLPISGVLNGILIKKTIEAKNKVENKRKHNKRIIEKKRTSNSMKIKEYGSLIKQIDFTIKVKEEKIDKINNRIFEVKNHTMPKNYYPEKAKVIELKKTK